MLKKYYNWTITADEASVLVFKKFIPITGRYFLKAFCVKVWENIVKNS